MEAHKVDQGLDKVSMGHLVTNGNIRELPGESGCHQVTVSVGQVLHHVPEAEAGSCVGVFARTPVSEYLEQWVKEDFAQVLARGVLKVLWEGALQDLVHAGGAAVVY